jgi:TonB family protein
MGGPVIPLLFALAAHGAPASGPREVSPLVVVPQPKDAPHPDATVVVGSDQDSMRGQAVSIWPAGALQAGANGYVTLACRIDAHGLAEACRVIYENPRGRGFGKAALALRPTFKVAPPRGPDGPEPATLNIAVAFRAKAMQSNFQDVFRVASGRAAVPEDSLDPSQNVGHHEMNGRNLVVYDNPITTRRMTMLTEPAWGRAPGFDAWASAYPAAGGGVEGYVVVHCRVQASGALQRCAVVKETPVGHGFGKAALALAARFQASPQAMAQAPHGAPVEVDVPIRFAPPAEAADRTVRAPVFLAGADPESLAHTLPPGRSGSQGAVVTCKVAADGALSDCGIELTSPDGLDFDEAAVRLASRLRVNLWSAEASPVVGGTIHLPVRPGGPGRAPGE